MRFCVLDLDNSKKWFPKTFGDLFEEGLKLEGDTWDHFDIANGDKPPHDLLDYQGVILTGSRFNTRDRDSLHWFDDICKFIVEAANRGSPKVYGGCFGCQIIAHALGGEVGYNPNGIFLLRAETIRLNDQINQNKILCDKLSEKDTLNILVSHGDCVQKLPDSGVLLGSSANCKHEIYLAGPHKNILAFQSHPEFDLKYAIEERIWPAVVEDKKRLSEDEIVESKKTFEKYDGKDSRLALDTISLFIHESRHQ